MMTKKKTHKQINKKTKIHNRKLKYSIKNKSKSKSKSKSNQINKQHGSSLIMNSIFSVKPQKSYRIPGTAMFNKTKNLFTPPPKQQFLTINYNYHSPQQITINNNITYDSNKLLFFPHITLNHNMHALFVMILPAAKPILVWAVNMKFRVQTPSIIPYKLPLQPLNKEFRILYRLYKYPNNIGSTFNFKNLKGYNEKETIHPTLAYEKLQAYLKLHKMAHALSDGSGYFTIRQGEGSNKTNIFNIITQTK